MEFIPDITLRRASIAPERIAFHDVISGEDVTYKMLDARASAAATVLSQAGIRAGDRVVILCRNRIEFFEILFACGKLGAILVPLNWRMPAAELADLLADCEPSLTITGAEDRATAEAAMAQSQTPILDLETDYPAQRNAAAPHPGRPTWPASDAWYLIYTSGTTGRPKGVIQTYGMALINYINISQPIGLRSTDATLNFLPLFHTAGINLHTLPVLIAGGLVNILPGFDPGRMLSLINAGALDVFIGVPAIYRELSLHPDFETTDLTRLRHWACGGAPLPDSLVECFAKRGAVVCNGFGLTETGPTAFLVDAENALDKIGSVGQTQIMTRARIADRQDREVASGIVGEVQFFGPGLTPGYWRRPEETETLFTADSWLKSGDLGRIDEDGYCYVVGRLKEMFISGGENIYPAEIENVLDRHPAVLEAAVTGVADEKWGEVGSAHIMLRPGEQVEAAQILDWCRQHLAAYKLPKHIRFAQDFPRTAAGKVKKHMLPQPLATN
jgi:fatty-acyl-CoA synthase